MFSRYLGMFIFLLILIQIWIIKADNCPLPDADINSKVTTNALTPGSVATYSCDKDYELFGSGTRTCAEDGAWSGDVPICATNVAWRKPTNQSSTVRGGSAQNANDGDAATVHDGDKCTETKEEDSPWWSVDLLQEYEISHIRITTRGCCGIKEIQNLEVRVGYYPTLQKGNRLCAWYPGVIENGSTEKLKCARPMKGRYVFIQMVGVTGALSLCEVEVFSRQEISKDRCRGDVDINNLGLFNRTCYEFQVKSGGTFEIAQDYCQQRRGGDLVNRIEPLTQSFLVSELDRIDSRESLQTKLLWIGAQKDPLFISRTWRWVDGTEIDSPSWGPEQPNNYNGKQNCVVLDGAKQWLWNDVGCNLNYLYWMCQFQPSCGTPDRKLNTTFEVQSSVDSVVALYSCPVGNKVEGNQTRACSMAGYWSGEAPSCTYIDCHTPPSTENGVVSLVDSRSTFGARAMYVCAENYTLDGNNTIFCGDEGEWEPRIPKCLYSWCPELKAPENGTIISSGRRSGDEARYKCMPGYYLVGPESLFCVLGGEWSGQPPTCRFVDCGIPENLKNGKMTLVNSTTFVGSLAVYSCDDDYLLVGDSVRTCRNNGEWDKQKPTCEPISCGEPEVPVGGYVTGYSFDIHSQVDYHCDPGHFMTGEPKRVCTRDGSWSGEAATCTFVDCGRVPAVMKAEVKYKSDEFPTYLNSTITYRCMPHHRLIGDEVRVCLKTGAWSGKSPRCEEVRCPYPEQPKKSRFSVARNDRRSPLALSRTRPQLSSNVTYKVGSMVTYRCERGHALDGQNNRICLANGTWSTSAPECRYVDCGLPPPVEKGVYRLLSNETILGSVVSYECDVNWRVEGQLRRHCLGNGSWSLPYAKCVEVLCPSLTDELAKRYSDRDAAPVDSWNTKLLAQIKEEKALRIAVDDDERRVGSIATYMCRDGQRVIGERQRVCKKHGVWDGNEPKCEWVYCERPADLENGRVHLLSEDLLYGSVIEYFCLPNYYLHGPFNRTCSNNGTWTGVNPRCTLNDRDIGGFEDNTIDGSSKLGGRPPDQDSNSASYTGIYVGLAVSFFLILGVGLALLFFKTRERQMAKSGSADSSSSTKPVEPSRPPVIAYGDLNDPTTGNHIYEYIPEDLDNGSSYTSMSTPTSFTPSAMTSNNYANISSNNHTYSNSSMTDNRPYANSSPVQSSGYINHSGPFSHSRHMSRRPRMPPPQPPQVPTGSAVGVTVNGVAVNGSHT